MAEPRNTLDTVAAILHRLDGEFREFREEIRTGFVRADVQHETIARIHDRIDDIDERHAAYVERLAAAETRSSNNRKWVVGAFVAPVICAIVVAILITSIGLHR